MSGVESELGGATATQMKVPSLRERKCAKTKLALVRAALSRMSEKRFDAITVKELCEDAELSEATFFNYFPRKDDLLRYYTQLWAIELGREAEARVGARAGIEYIEHVFESTGRQVEGNPSLLLQLLRFLAQNPDTVRKRESRGIALAEQMHAFPGLGDAKCNICGLTDLFLPPLERAIESCQLTRTLDTDAALLALLNTFCGVPLWLGETEPAAVRSEYARQLELLWTGMRAGACSKTHPGSP